MCAHQEHHHRPSIRSASTSPSWLENLRFNCLALARENRTQYVAEKRRLSSSPTAQGGSNPAQRIAQQLVQSELSRHKIQVSPPASHPQIDATTQINHLTHADVEYMQEMDLYQLMQQVEAELEREGTINVVYFTVIEHDGFFLYIFFCVNSLYIQL